MKVFIESTPLYRDFAASLSSPCLNGRPLAFAECIEGNPHLISIFHEVHPGVASEFVLLNESPNLLSEAQRKASSLLRVQIIR